MSKRVAIVTGASRGIGKAIADELAVRGYEVVRVSRNPDGDGFAADISRADDAKRIVDTTIQKFGRIDVLVNNAGFAPVRKIEQMTHDEWRSVMDTNLSSVFYLSQAVWPTFRAQKSGVIVNISSLAARDPFAGFFAYGAAKAGLNLMGLALAREGAEFGIRVHTIAPAAVETAMFRGILTEEQYSRDKTLEPAHIAKIAGQCIAGELQYTSGEVIWVHKTV